MRRWWVGGWWAMSVAACGEDRPASCSASDGDVSIVCDEFDGMYECSCARYDPDLGSQPVGSFSDPDICEAGIAAAEVVDLCALGEG